MLLPKDDDIDFSIDSRDAFVNVFDGNKVIE